MFIDKNSVSGVSKFVYDFVNETKKRIPLFLVACHIYITNTRFSHDKIDAYNNWAKFMIISYMFMLGISCLIWEFIFALKATIKSDYPCYSEVPFAIYITLTRFINLMVICLFTTNGDPINILTHINTEIITNIFYAMMILNYALDKIEQYVWTDNWKNMYNIRNEEELKILEIINQKYFQVYQHAKSIRNMDIREEETKRQNSGVLGLSRKIKKNFSTLKETDDAIDVQKTPDVKQIELK